MKQFIHFGLIIITIKIINCIITNYFDLVSQTENQNLCPTRNASQIPSDRSCSRRCNTVNDCKGSYQRCLCDDVCGFSCFAPGISAGSSIINYETNPRFKVEAKFIRLYSTPPNCLLFDSYSLKCINFDSDSESRLPAKLTNP